MGRVSWFQKLFGGVSDEDVTLTVKLRLTRWRHLLRAEQALEHTLSDMMEKLDGDYVLDRQYVHSSASLAFQEALRAAYDTGVLCDLEESTLYDWIDELKREVTAHLTGWPLITEGPLVVPLAPQGARLGAHQIGEPARQLLEVIQAHLAEIPPGLIITCQAFLHLLAHNRLDHHLKPEAPADPRSWEAAYQALAAALPEASIPEALVEALTTTRGEPDLEAVDSDLVFWPSSLHSDTVEAFPFPTERCSGPSSTIWPWSAVLRCWSRLYADPGLARLSAKHRYPILAAVVCQRFQGGPALVVRTLDPGVKALTVRPVADDLAQDPLREGGVERVSRIPPHATLDGRRMEDLEALAKISLRIERSFRRAQEILWQREPGGRHRLLQLRRQKPERGSAALPTPPPPVLERGRGLTRGVGSGPTVQLGNHRSTGELPERAVLVATAWRREWEPLLPRVSAILLESPPDTAATARMRSSGVPVLTHLPQVEERFAPGTVVTVDAEDHVVYEGEADELIEAKLLAGPRLEDEPEYVLLRWALTLLGDQSDAEGADRPESLARGVARAHFQVLDSLLGRSGMGELARRKPVSLRFSGEQSLPLHLLDLGGGLPSSDKGPRSVVDPGEIRSAPFAPFWRGLASAIGQGSRPSTEEHRDLLLLAVSDSALHVSGQARGGRFVLDASLTSVRGLNHLFYWWQAEPPDALEESAISDACDVRCFGRPAEDLEERLWRVGHRRFGKNLDPAGAAAAPGQCLRGGGTSRR